MSARSSRFRRSQKHATTKTRLILMMLFAMCSGVAAMGQSATPQSTPPPTPRKGQEAALDAGCLNYNLNVMTLEDNTRRIFFKMDDCIRVHTWNNPFIFKYQLSFDEKPIPEDDPLGAFAGKFGLNVSSGTKGAGSGHTDQATSVGTKPLSPQTKSQLSDLMQYTQEIQKDLPHSGQFADAFRSAQSQISDANLEKSNLDVATNHLDNARGTLQHALDTNKAAATKGQEQLNTLAGKIDAIQKSIEEEKEKEESQRAADLAGLKKSSEQIHKDIDDKEKKFTVFSNDVLPKLQGLIDETVNVQTQPDVIPSRAREMRKYATDKLAEITDQNSTPGGYASAEIEQELVNFAHQAARLHRALSKLTQDTKTKGQLDDLHDYAQQVVVDACSYKARTENDFSTIKTGIIDPIDAVLSDPLSFGYKLSAIKREGPWTDPESVTIKLTRSEVKALLFTATTSTGKPANSSPQFTCSSDTTDLFEFGDSYVSFGDFFTDKAVKPENIAGGSANKSDVKPLPNVYLRNSNNPSYSSSSKKPVTKDDSDSEKSIPTKGQTGAATDTTVFAQSWLFGKPRLVVSGGLSTAFLQKQEFQRSSSISGSTSQTVIGLKTDTLYRNTPMLYGQVLLYSKRYSPNAWYGTFGVTANSDSKGTSPEFLLGLSRSLVQQRFFLTAGAYIGERQTLDGGLKVGDVIPSTLTGDLPVTKSYRAGFAIGLSFRLSSPPDTKDSKGAKSGATQQPTKSKDSSN